MEESSGEQIRSRAAQKKRELERKKQLDLQEEKRM
jgi:hypothetical protein